MSRLYDKYIKEILPVLKKEFQLENQYSLPRMTKVVLSMGLGKAISEKSRLEAAISDLTRISAQKPVICRAKKSVSNFKLREGMDIGLKVTLRGKRMFDFVDRLISIVLPRFRDFQGLPPSSFDGRGAYNFGIAEQSVFSEIDSDKITFVQGMNISIVVDNSNDIKSRRLLQLMGMPFKLAKA